MHTSQHDKHVTDFVSGILSSDSLSNMWTKHHKSKADQNSAIDLSQKVQDISQNIEAHPEMLLFMRELIEIELVATNKSSELGQYLEQLYSYINKLCHDNNISLENTEMPEDYQSLLDMVEYQTGKTPIRPIHSLWKITKSMGKHIADDAKEHPALFGSLVSVAVGMVYLSSLNVDKFATVNTEEGIESMAGFSGDIWGDDSPLDELTTEGIIFDSPLDEPVSLDPSCHDTTIELGRLIAGDYGAWAATNLPSFITDAFPEHCTRVKSLAGDAIGGMQSGFDWIHERLDVVIRDPANNIGNSIMENMPFQTAFIEAANATADVVYRFNDIENIAVHTLLTGVTASAVVKLGSLKTEEAQELKASVFDFIHRTTRNLPLSYILSCGGSTYAYMANDGFAPDIIWLGLGGIVAGNTIHKIARSCQSHKLIESATISVNKTAAEISDATKILMGGANNNDYSYQHKGWKDYIKKPAMVAGVTTTLTALDIAVTGGEISGAIAGGATVTAQYLMYNVVEDTALHGVFIGLGAAIGTTILCAAAACNKLKGLIRNDNDNNIDPY